MEETFNTNTTIMLYSIINKTMFIVLFTEKYNN